MNTKKISAALYFIAFLIIVISTFIAILSESGFSTLFSKIDIFIAFTLIIIGKILTVISKDRKDKSVPLDIGVILGILVALIGNIIKK